MSLKTHFAQAQTLAAKKLNRLSTTERNQLTGALCAVLVIFYLALFWFPAHQHLDEMQYKQQKLNAQKKHSGSDKPAPALALKDGFNPQQIKAEAEQVAASIALLDAEKARLNKRFVPLDDLDLLQSLKSGITRVAEAGDMEVVALEHIYRKKEDYERPPTPQLLKEAGEGNPYRRPLLKLRGRASYRGLMQFLEGLGKLEFVAAPVWADITVGMEKKEKNAPPTRQWLEVEVHLAI